MVGVDVLSSEDDTKGESVVVDRVEPSEDRCDSGTKFSVNTSSEVEGGSGRSEITDTSGS